MAKGSKKDACSAHVDAAKANCLKHDRREGKIPSYVNPHLTHTNRTVYEDEMIRGRKSITPLVNRAEKLYTEKTGQKCQKSFTPFREDVLRIKAGITDDQLMAFKDQVEKATGWKVVGIWLHQDEGHYHSKYIEGDENYDINYHAHVLYSCQDQETGKAIRLGRNYFRLRQDWLAEATGMERGNSAAETGIRHRSSQQQRIDAQEKRIEELLRVTAEKDAALDLIKKELANLSKGKAVKEAAIAKIGEYADKARAAGAKAKAAGAAAAESGKAVTNWVKGKFNLSDKDDVIKAQKAQIATLTDERDKAKASEARALQKAQKAASEGYNKALEDVRRQSRLSWPQWEGTSLLGIVSKINDAVETKDLWYQDNKRLERENERLKRQLDPPSQSQGMKR